MTTPTMLTTWLPGVVAAVLALAALGYLLRAARHRRALADDLSTLGSTQALDSASALHVGKYRVIRKIGVGGMAKVYLASGPDGRKVALKIPDPFMFQTEEHRDFFRRELSVSKKMQHPNVVRILDYSDGSTGGLPFIAMEYVDGVTLDKELPKQRPVPLGMAARILHDVVAALEYAHNMGVVHRDIKPENIMLSRDGTVKVADFGIARDLWESQRAADDEGAFVGSPHYMSPEQINSEHVDYRTDYYAVGVVAFRLLTGYLPFEGETTMEVIARKISQLPPPPSTYNPTLPFELESLVRELMQREPERRPVAAVGIRKTLRKFLDPPKKRHEARKVDEPKEAEF